MLQVQAALCSGKGFGYVLYVGTVYEDMIADSVNFTSRRGLNSHHNLVVRQISK